FSEAIATMSLLFSGEADRLAAERVVLAQGVALPVVLHQDPGEVRVALGADAHQVPGLALVPVGGRPDRDDARNRLAVVEPDLDANPAHGLARRWRRRRFGAGGLAAPHNRPGEHPAAGVRC